MMRMLLIVRNGDLLNCCSERRSAHFLLAVLFLAVFFVASCSDKAAETDLIKGKIVKYDIALQKMYRTHDISVLKAIVSEKEYAKNEALIASYYARSIYMESKLLDMRFDSIEKKGRNGYEVIVWEKWRWRHMDVKTKKEVDPWVDEEYRLKYMLSKDKKKGWVINSVEILK